MKITKLGHCCLVIETGTVKILTDPGTWTVEQNTIQGLTAVLITHEHADHFHIESLKQVIQNNPQVQIITNHGVGRLLDEAGIMYTLLEHGQDLTVAGVSVKGIGEIHAEIYPGIPQVPNTGYLIDQRLFYPGDALTLPGEPVEILALPVAGPWLKLQESIEYGLAVKPHICVPVHDGMLKIADAHYRLSQQFLEPAGITFIPLAAGQMYEV